MSALGGGYIVGKSETLGNLVIVPVGMLEIEHQKNQLQLMRSNISAKIFFSSQCTISILGPPCRKCR